MVEVSCGGWRRPYSYYLGKVPEHQNCFAFVKVRVSVALVVIYGIVLVTYFPDKADTPDVTYLFCFKFHVLEFICMPFIICLVGHAIHLQF
jgi:hypothetical protein